MFAEQIMKTVATFREAGSLVAGLLIGLSIVVPMFALTVADPGDREITWIVVTLIVLALGLMLQAVLTTRPRQRRTNEPDLAAAPLTFMELSHER